VISSTRSWAALPFFERTTMKIFSMSGHDQRSFSTSDFPTNPVADKNLDFLIF
jgi:hypothetical protein